MGAKSPVKMSELGEELGFLRERELNIYRSGSAPPTVEGSLNAVGGLNANSVLNEEELRSDPAYSSYYYSHVNLNPRLPPPSLSKEDWRSTQRLGVIGSREKEVGNGGEWVSGKGDGLIGLSLRRQKSFADIFQEELGQTTSIPDYSSHPSRNIQSVVGLQNKSPQTFASVLASSTSRNSITDSHQVAGAPSPTFLNVGVQHSAINNEINATSDGVNANDLLAALSGMKLSISVDPEQIFRSKHQQEYWRNTQNYVKQSPFSQSSRSSISNSVKSPYLDSSESNVGLGSDGQVNSYMKAPFAPFRSCSSSSPANYQKADSTNATLASYGLTEYSINPALPPMLANQIGTGNLPPLFENAAAASALAALGMDSRALGGSLSSDLSLNGSPKLQSPNRIGNIGNMSLIDPYIQYLKTAEYVARALSDPSMERGYMNAYLDLLGMQDPYPGGLHHNHYGAQFMGKSGVSSNHGYFNNPAFGVNVSYPGSPVASPVASPVGLGTHGLSSFPGGRMGSWNLDLNGNLDGVFPSTLLEEFKSSKTRCFELFDIAGHVVEFSADQYGSRFIQQKLETATTEEKNMVFEEIMPQALSLMTDVFGNYVVQKFFEHGTATQIRELASQLNGHVLALSLQMYGCRVIQKAIEVVDLDQQTNLVTELDGHIMRCVRDQNGNHVIQKCIECIPQEAIQFIISSFYDQVVTLSTHPYGCRVIQRVLEHCDDPTTQQIVMHEIMQCVCMLAQDQYGNYVVQHVLEHGKPHERSEIIKKLAGQIVQMSQQKFASNVVEKCLTFSGPVERQILVNEMLGSTDENEPLQAMMKDQFANYVVQKVLETCDDQQRELILSRIKVHLSALKKYTYGKHIVARVEKLVAAGERRIGLQFSYLS